METPQTHTLISPQAAKRGALVLGIASLGSYILGLVRDRLMASIFGASLDVDVYNSAFIVPEFLLQLWITGALSLALVPVLTHYISKGQAAQAFRSINALLSLLGVIILVIEVAAFIFMPQLSQLVAPGFDTAQHELIIRFSRLLMLAALSFTLSGVLGGILVSTRRFLGFALSSLLYNLGIIAGIVLLSDRFGVESAVWGAIVGAFLHMLVRIPGARAAGYRFSAIWDLKDEGVRKIIRLALPRMGGLFIYEGNLWLYNALGSLMSAGSIAIFNFARNFQSVPVSLFGISLATAAFPLLSQHFAHKDEKKFMEEWAETLNKILFFTIPSAIGFLLLSRPMVSTFLEAGRFTAEDSAITALVLSSFAWSAVFESVVHHLARTFYARHETVTPMKVILVATAVNAVVCLALSNVFGVVALPLGFTALTLTQTLVLLYILKRRLFNLRGDIVIPVLMKILLACGAMIIVIVAWRWVVTSPRIELLGGVVLGGVSFIAAAYLLRLTQVRAITDIIRRKLKLT